MTKGQQAALESRNDRIDILISEYNELMTKHPSQRVLSKIEQIIQELGRINALHILYQRAGKLT